MACLQEMEPCQDVTFTHSEVSLELALISMHVSIVRCKSIGRELPMIPACIRWTHEHDVQIRREVWEDRHSLDRVLHEAHTVPRVVILVPAIPKEDHLDVRTGDDHLFNLRELGEVDRDRLWAHVILSRH